MNHFDRVQAFIELCESKASSIESITAGFRRALEELGFRYFACCSHVDPLDPPSHAIVVHNYPATWVRQFSDEKLYRIDPVLQHAGSHLTPFFWDAAFPAHAITTAQRRVLAEAELLGLAHGYTIPIEVSWMPGALRASCSVVPDDENIEPRSYTTVQIMALYLYASASRARVPCNTVLSVELTPRERECLTLAAQGKGDWTIGRVLCLSEHTVHSHIEKVKQRLGVSTRVQAIVQSVMTGQISLGDVVRRTAPADRHGVGSVGHSRGP